MNMHQLAKPIAGSAAAFVLAAGLALSANAQTVLLDFGTDDTFRGLSVQNPDNNGNYWTSIGTGYLAENLVDIDNVPTTIDFGFSTNVGTDSYNGPGGATTEDEQDLIIAAELADFDPVALGNIGGAPRAVFDYVTGPADPSNELRFELQGLDPSKLYELTFYGAHAFSDNAVTVYSVYTDNSYTTLVASASLEVYENPEFFVANRDDLAVISGLSPQTDDILYVQVLGSTGGLGYLNAMQIVATDAPAPDTDYNGDGSVDGADYVAWRKLPGAFGGDPDGYTAWSQTYGDGNSGSGGAVPEPTSLLLVMVAIGGVMLRNRWR